MRERIQFLDKARYTRIVVRKLSGKQRSTDGSRSFQIIP